MTLLVFHCLFIIFCTVPFQDSSRGSWEDQGSSDDAPPLNSLSSANQRANYINNNEPSYNSSSSVIDGNKKSSSWASAQQARVDQWIDSSCQVSLSRRSDSEDGDMLHTMGSESSLPVVEVFGFLH